LVRDNGKLLPLRPRPTERRLAEQRASAPHTLLVIVLRDHGRTDEGYVLEHQIRLRVPDAKIVYVDPLLPPRISDDLIPAAERARAVVVAVYQIPSAARAVKTAHGLKNSLTLPDASRTLLGKILARAGAKTAVLAMGNPYLAADFTSVQNYICAFSDATVSEISAVRALFGEIPIRGHLPVTIPNIGVRSAELATWSR
jgi:beta-N-acetylhexosaminidase